MQALVTSAGPGVRLGRRSAVRWPDLRGPGSVALAVVLTASVSTLVSVDRTSDRAESVAATSAATESEAATSELVLPGQTPDGLTTDEWMSIQRQIAAAEAIETAPALVARTGAAVGSAPTLESFSTVAAFEPSGAMIEAIDGDGRLNLRTTQIGSIQLSQIAGVATAEGVEYRHAPAVTEWFRESPAGLQQGFTLAAAVTPDPVTVIEVSVDGVPTLIDPQTVRIETSGGAVFWYRDLLAWDATGATLPASMGVASGVITLDVDTERAVYPVTIDPVVIVDPPITGPQTSGDRVGQTVAVGDNVFAFAAAGDDDDGREFGKVEVWRFDGATADHEAAYYEGSGAGNDWGYSIVFAGDRLYIGAPGADDNGFDSGAVYYYTRGASADPFGYKATLYACSPAPCDSAAAPSGGFDGARFGEAIAVSDDGSTLMIGAPNHDVGPGQVYVLDDTGPTYEVIETFTGSGVSGAPAVGDAFGAAIDLAGDASLAVVGAPGSDFSGVPDSGLAYTFADAGSWTEQDQITPAFHGTAADANFGAAVAMETTGSLPYAVISEPFLTRLPDDVGGGAGGAFVYDLSDPAAVPAPTGFGVAVVDDGFGFDVAAEGDWITIGAPFAGTNGEIRRIERSGAVFSAVSTDTGTEPAGGTDAGYGYSVDIGTAGYLAIGAPFRDSFDTTPNGPARIGIGQLELWDDVSALAPTILEIDGPSDTNRTAFGRVVARDGDRMAITSFEDAAPLPGSGSVSIFERASVFSPWLLLTTIFPPDPLEDGHFGESLDLLGDDLLIGESGRSDFEPGPGRVYAYRRDISGAWLQRGATIEGTFDDDAFGASVAWVSADEFIVGSPDDFDYEGSVHRVQFSGGWLAPVQLDTTGVQSNDRLGASVAVYATPAGYVVVAGAPGDDSAASDAGAVWIYESTGGAVPVLQDVVAPVGVFDAGDAVGTAVAADGGRILVGGLSDQINGSAFTAHVIEDPGTGWEVVWSFSGALGGDVDGYPNSYLDIYGGTLAIGRPGGGGQVGLFRHDGTTWPALPDDQLIPLGTVPGDAVGISVDLDGNVLAAGAPGFDARDNGGVFILEVPAVVTFTGEVDADYETPGNWDVGTVPLPTDGAIIPSGSTVEVSGFVESGGLTLMAGAQVDVLDGGNLSLFKGWSGSPSPIGGTIQIQSGGYMSVPSAEAIELVGGTIDLLAGGEIELNSSDEAITIAGSGTWNNAGTLTKMGFDVVAIGSGISWNSSGTGLVDVVEGDLSFAMPVLELGTLRTGAGGFTPASIRYDDDFAADPSAVIELEIDGPPSVPTNFGTLAFNWTFAPDFGGATLRTIGGYVPSPSDVYDAITCYDCGSPDFVYDIGDLELSVTGTVPGQTMQLAPPVALGNLVVDTLGDTVAADGLCSLREAVTAANADTTGTDCGDASGADVISFDVSGTIALGSRLPIITSDITVDGSEQDVTISGQSSQSVARINTTGALTLVELTIIDGWSQACDGGDTCGPLLNYGDLSVTDSTFDSNGSTGIGLLNGGAITNRGSGQVAIDNTTFSNNGAGIVGAIWNASDAPHTAPVPARVVITNSTFVGNSAARGAIYNTWNAEMTIANSTFVDNTSDASNGVINNGGGVDALIVIANSTFSGHNGGRTLNNPAPSTLELRNTIITGASGGPACSGSALIVDGFNIADDATCVDATVSDSLDLDVLADNGGPTETVALLADSVAIGAGDPTVCDAGPVNGVDQRGIVREATGCDVGAYAVPTLVVNDTGDDSDFAIGDTVCETGAGSGVCTLRAAIEQANASSGLDRIHFDIPGGGVQTISPLTSLPTISGTVTIDGLTQPGTDCASWPATINIEVIAANAVNGLTLAADDSLVRGLALGAMSGTGIQIDGNGNQVQCNFIGTDAAGDSLGSTFRGIEVNGDGNTIGGAAATDANLVTNNGLNQGVWLYGGSNTLQGNHLQVTLAGDPVAGCCMSRTVVALGADNVIGGVNPGEGNRIGARTGTAIAVIRSLPTYPGTGITIRGNSIVRDCDGVCDPTRLGIDLGDDFLVAANDPLDADVGPNRFQNYPDVAGAVALGGSTQVIGSLNSAASSNFEIDVYSSAVCNASGFGEGEILLGTIPVATDASGNVNFDEIFPIATTAGGVITATATDMTTGDTSEFSACQTVIADIVPANKVLPTVTTSQRFGASVSVDGDWAAVGQPDTGGAGGVVSILERNPGDGSWAIVQTITDGALGGFGRSVSLDGNTLAIAGNVGGGGGEVQIHLRPDTSTPFAVSTYLGASDQPVVDLSGDDVIIGSSGAVDIWSRASGSWQVELSTFGSATFGATVAIDGDVAAVGDSSNLIAGSVIVYERSGTTWTVTDTFTNPEGVIAGSDWFGSALDIDGTTLVIGHSLAENPAGDEGAAWVYEGLPGAWDAPQKLSGSAIGTGDVFGQSVSVDGAWIVVGAPNHEEAGSPTRDGGAFVFAKSGATWVETDYLQAEDRAPNDSFGAAVGIFDDGSGVAHVLAGAPFDDNSAGADRGAVYSFTSTPPPAPIEGRLTAPDAAPGDYFGQSVDILDDWLVVGARNGDGAVADSGTVYVFRRDPSTDEWNYFTELQASDGVANQGFGFSVAIGGKQATASSETGTLVIAVGAPEFAGAGNGAAYLYRFDSGLDSWVEMQRIDAPVGDVDFGMSVDIEQVGQDPRYQLAIGAPSMTNASNPGVAYLYSYQLGGAQLDIGTLSDIATADSPAPGAGNQFGFAVALDGADLIIGEPNAPSGGTAGAGRAHIFSTGPFGVVSHVATLAQPAADEVANDNFGRVVDIDGVYAVAGSHFDRTPSAATGAAYVYRRTAVGWGAATPLVSVATSAGHNYGAQVRVQDGVIAVSSLFGGSNGAGTVQVFSFDSASGWTTGPALEWQDGTSATVMGVAMALGEDGVLAVGAAEDDNTAGVDAGGVQIFDVNIPLASNKVTTAQDIDFAEFGGSVDVDGEWAIVGAIGGGGTGEGSAYMFRKVAGEWQLFQELDDQFNPLGAGDDYGVAVAVGGSFAAIADQDDETSVYWFDGAAWVFAGDFFSLGVAGYSVDLDIDGATDRLIVGYSQSGAVGQVEIYDLVPASQPVAHAVVAPTVLVGALYGKDVAIEGDFAFATAEHGVNGSVVVFERDGTTWTEVQSLSAPDGQGQVFGSDVAVDDNSVIIGQRNNSRAVIFENVGGTWTDPVVLWGATGQLGTSVSISGDLAVMGTPWAAADDRGVHAAELYARAGSQWVLTDTVTAPDTEPGDGFGVTLALSGNSLLVGASLDTNIDGARAGAAYLYDVIQPDNPTLTFDLSLASAPIVQVAPGGLAVTEFSGAALERNADANGTVAAAPLSAIDVADAPLSAIPLGSTPLSAIVLGSTPLSAIPLSAIDIDGGWEDLIANTTLADVPFSTLTFDDALLNTAVRSQVEAAPLSAIDVNGTPLSAIPLSAIALGSTPLSAIPLSAIGGSWCDIVTPVIPCTTDADLSNVSLMEATLRGVPLSAIPLSAIPLSAIDFTDPTVAASPLSAIPLSAINLNASPLSAIPLSAIPLSAIGPTSTPLSAIPLSAIGLDATPLSAIPLSAINVGSTPLSAIPLSAINVGSTPLSAIPVSIPLSAIPLSAIDVSGAPLSAIQVEGAPLSAIPLSAILLADSPLSAIPLSAIGAGGTNEWCDVLAEAGTGFDCTTGADPSTTTLRELSVRGVPLSAIPLSAIPLSAIDLSASPLSAIPLSAIPLSAIPLSAIPLSAIDLQGTPLSAIDPGATPLSAIPLSAIPLSAIDLQASPLSAIPLSAIPLSAIPLSAIPLSAIPLSAIPLSAIPLSAIDVQGSPLSAIPLSAIDVQGSPLSAIPLSAIPLSAINCGLVDCDTQTLGEAVTAGAADLSAIPLSAIHGATSGIRLGELVPFLTGITADEVTAALAALGLTMNDLTTLDDMELGDIALLPQLDGLTLSDIEAALYHVRIADLVGALIDPSTGRPFDATDAEGALRDAVDDLPLTFGDLLSLGDVTVGELIEGGLPITLDDIQPVLGFITVQAVLDYLGATTTLPPLSLGDLTAEQLGQLTLADLFGEGISEFDSLDLGDLLAQIQNELEAFTLGDLLLLLLDASSLSFDGADFEHIDIAELPASTLPPVTFSAEFNSSSPAGRAYPVELDVNIPSSASYMPGSAVLTVTDGGFPPVVTPLEPTEGDNSLSWSFTAVGSDVDYEVTFDVKPQVTLGASVLQASARLVGTDVSISTKSSVSVAEGLEPNNFPPPEVTPLVPDTIYLTYIPDATDVDVFEITLNERDVLALDLSNLSADFDLALYVDGSTTGAVGTALAPAGSEDPITPLTDPDQTGADAEVLDDFPRLDDIDPNLELLEVSNARGVENELIVTDQLPAGTYYVQVFGANGAMSPQPAALQARVDSAENRPVCQAVGALPSAPFGAAPVIGAATNTLFLVNEMRLEQMYSAADRAAVMGELNSLVAYLEANPNLGVSPAVVAVDSFANVRAAYDAWDNPTNIDDACNPEVANAVVSAINTTIIDPIRDQIEYIVMIGGDDQIPMARLQDGTAVANEYDYRHEFDGDLAGANANAANSFTSVFWESRFLSDEPYGESAAQSLGSRYLYVADAALGRLVETPDQIVRSLSDFATHQGTLDIDTGAVLGYDFLADGSAAVAAELQPISPTVSTELADGYRADGAAWDRVDAQDELVAAGQQALISLNAHFDHYRALPANGDQKQGFTDNLIASTVAGLLGTDGLAQSLIFSMGCHSGLAVPDNQITGTNADWAQQISGSGGIYIANTGFGYGDTEAVAYTEQLMALFAQNVTSPVLIDGIPTTVGEAFKVAKNRFIADLAVLSVYDEKAMMESTFYGLPFYRTALPTVTAPPVPVNEPVIGTTGDPVVSYTVDPTNDRHDTDRGVYYSNPTTDGGESIIVAPGRPIQPSTAVDVSVVDPLATDELAQIAHGAVILDMTSTYVSEPDPVIATPIFDESDQGLEPAVGEQTFPAKPVKLSTFESIAGTRQQVVLATGQYRADAGSQRLDSDIDVLVNYAPPGETDFDEPTISNVTSTVTGGLLTVSLTATDASSVDRVYALVAENPGSTTVDWRGFDLTRNGSTDRWSGSLALAPATTTVEFIVQAQDGVGNVGYATNKAKNFTQSTLPPPPPPPTPGLTVEPASTNLDVATGWYTGDVSITVTTGADGATYSVDGGVAAPVPPTGEFTITGDGIHTYVVTNGTGQQQTGTVRIDTSNPVIQLGTPQAGASYVAGVGTIDLSCSDPSLVSCDITINGAPVDNGAPLPTTPGNYVLVVNAMDVLGNTTSASVQFDVAGVTTNSAPEILLIDAPTEPELISDGIFIDIEFDDADGAADDYTVTIDWGDSEDDDDLTTPTPTVCEATSSTPQVGNPTCEIVAEPGAAGVGVAVAGFTYAAPGVYRITVTVTDSAGLSDTSLYDYVVVYDPGSGRVSGAGWYWSGPEAYDYQYDYDRPGRNDDRHDHARGHDRDRRRGYTSQHSRWGSWAFFGYNARYRRNADTPTGSTKLHLSGEFFFKSTSYDYLIVNDTVATAEGIGKMNGHSGYRFRVQGIDNGWLDYFQLTIWNEETGETVYDNGVLFDEGDVVLLGGIKVRS